MAKWVLKSTITESQRNPIDTEKLHSGDSYSHTLLGRDDLSLKRHVVPPEPSSTGTWSYSTNHSDLWHLNSTHDSAMIQSPGHDEFSGSVSLTGLNILESTRNTMNTETNYSLGDSPMLRPTNTLVTYEGTTDLSYCDYEEPIDTDQQGAFDLEMYR